MARRLVAALVLAHGAAARVDEFVDVLIQVDVSAPAPPTVFAQAPTGVLAGLVRVAAGSDDGYQACSAADAVMASCVVAGHLAPTALPAAAERCLCCDGTTPVSAVYSSCASYALNEMPQATELYEVVSELYDGCRYNSDICHPDATRTFVPATTTYSPAPTACTSMAILFNSCVFKLDPSTADNREMASCFCHDQSGSYNTAIQDYAESCAPYARASMSSDYPVVTMLASFCDMFPPITETSPLRFTPAGSRTAGVFELPSSTAAAASETEAADNADAAPASDESAAPGVAVPRLTACVAAVALAFLLV